MKKTPRIKDIPPDEHDEDFDPILFKTYENLSSPVQSVEEKKKSDNPEVMEMAKKHRHFEMPEEE
ncbi:MAG TPA: hypothetical protein GX501_10290 [Clostridiaceae bacterium]|nr:hypothetical protein [Clostridiaceae bacterium]